MPQKLAVTLACFVLALSFAHAVPARPLYVPEDPPKRAVELNLRGTTWVGQDLIANRIMEFMADGTLRYGVAGKLTYDKASWKLEGDDLYFEMNNQYREFKGKVIGDTIVGKSWNKVGTRWDTNLRRQPDGKRADPLKR